MIEDADIERGAKHDAGKPRYSLIPWDAMAVFVDVLEHGAREYGAHSWSTVPDGVQRYTDAAQRHLAAILRSELIDPDSKLPHWGHLGVNALFVLALQLRGDARCVCGTGDSEAHDCGDGHPIVDAKRETVAVGLWEIGDTVAVEDIDAALDAGYVLQGLNGRVRYRRHDGCLQFRTYGSWANTHIDEWCFRKKVVEVPCD